MTQRQPGTGPPDPAFPVISVRGLRMRYGQRETLSGVSLTVGRGELLALLGPNGAGKTTIVEILEGYRRRAGGEVSVLGADPWRAGPAWRARIGVMLQQSGPEPELTVAECLRLYAGYYPDPWPASDLLELTGLTGQAGQRAAGLSGGQRRKLDLALALTGRPEVLFLDEPTTGFDPAARRDAWACIAALRDAGTTIVLTSHYLEEAEQLASRVAVLSNGALTWEGSPADLAARQPAATICFTLPTGTRIAELPGDFQAASRLPAGDTVTLTAADPLPALAALARWAERAGITLPDLEVRRAGLEDAYLELIGSAAAQAAP